MIPKSIRDASELWRRRAHGCHDDPNNGDPSDDSVDMDGVLLTALPAGAAAHVRRCTGGCGLAARLASFGLTSGVLLRVVQNTGQGPLIVLVRDTRVALGRGEAGRVLVTAREAGDVGSGG